MPIKGEARLAYYRRRRLEWRERVLAHLGGKCVVCGATERLNIHHRRGTDVAFKLSNAWSWTWKRQLVELAKCELRCDDHHFEDYAAEHGTARRYMNGCRCEACVEVKRKYNREWMAQRRADQRRDKVLLRMLKTPPRPRRVGTWMSELPNNAPNNAPIRALFVT